VAGAAGVGRVTVVSLPQPSVSLTTSSNGRPTTRLGKAGVARHVEGRCGIGSAVARPPIRCRMGTIYRAFGTYS
jgi:hypothetical protein